MLSEEEYDLIQGIRNAGKEHGIGLNHIPDGWLKSKKSSLRFKNPMYGLETDLETVREALKGEFTKTYEYRESSFKKGEAALKWADLHFGAYIRNLVLTQDFDSDILYNGLMESVDYVNTMLFEKVHVHIGGDLIESFSGLNHINSWMSMDPSQIGANSVKLCCEMLDKVLSQTFNLGSIKIVAGNHDRTSKNNDEDVKGGAAELIAWGLQLKGYDVEFHPMIITHEIEGINHINLHGHFGISKRPTEQILWKYGKKGMFNYISEGHLHSIIQKLTTNQRKNFKTLKDDAIDHRRSHLPPFFTGNYYSETLGFDTNAGYEVVWDNGKGKPNVFNGSV
ncbi:hypothetical protein J0X14_14150 [Muricauda sp. CAU 1633]|uniref:hypothetical protein n=1 Tax=Allomuricauda sp. CAU 1633 TaxID=2816036 RepID=UPI001A8FE0BE|nr:hypothetical protein [Muricauda sp. CAU 1633]MBO0323446.1 hypothetical protein [Muricauda sp. CAU 1633]